MNPVPCQAYQHACLRWVAYQCYFRRLARVWGLHFYRNGKKQYYIYIWFAPINGGSVTVHAWINGTMDGLDAQIDRLKGGCLKMRHHCFFIVSKPFLGSKRLHHFETTISSDGGMGWYGYMDIDVFMDRLENRIIQEIYRSSIDSLPFYPFGFFMNKHMQHWFENFMLGLLFAIYSFISMQLNVRLTILLLASM